MHIVPEGLADLFKEVWQKHTGLKVWGINHGWCYHFALVLKRIHGDRVKLHTTAGHAWIEVDGMFYDSNTPQGSSEPLCHYERQELPEDQFEEFWRTRGGSGPVRWDVINEVVSTHTQKANAA